MWAHVHDGFQVQTNSVSVNGTPGALMTIRKTGGVSTLAVIDGVRAALNDIKAVLPKDVSVKALFDQSIFVRAALHSVLLSAAMAAGLTALVIILFLGNVRLSVIILAAIPLSIITAVLFIKLAGQTLNTMTLGGFALAIGILVDNGTVVIENIERHVGMREPLQPGHRHRGERSGHPDISVDTLHMHRFRAGVPVGGYGQVLVLSLVTVRHRLAARESRALIHHGAGSVQLPDAGRGSSFCRGRHPPGQFVGRESEKIRWSASKRVSNGDSSAFGSRTATSCPGLYPRRA